MQATLTISPNITNRSVTSDQSHNINPLRSSLETLKRQRRLSHICHQGSLTKFFKQTSPSCPMPLASRVDSSRPTHTTLNDLEEQERPTKRRRRTMHSRLPLRNDIHIFHHHVRQHSNATRRHRLQTHNMHSTNQHQLPPPLQRNQNPNIKLPINRQRRMRTHVQNIHHYPVLRAQHIHRHQIRRAELHNSFQHPSGDPASSRKESESPPTTCR